MSADTKYLIMSELLGITPGAIRKAEEQASKIIHIVHGGRMDDFVLWSFESNSTEPIKTDDTVHTETRIPKAQAQRKGVPRRKSPGQFPPDANQIIADMRAEGMTHKEIAAKLGVTESASKKRYAKWKKEARKASDYVIEPKEVYEAGAIEAAIEALVRSMDRPGIFDSEILEVIDRKFPDNGMNTDDIACMRWKV